MVEQQALSNEHLQMAFRPEFYERATEGQIRDDVVSYLAEYRFEVPDFEYKMGFVDDKLIDPNSRESMTLKAQKAIELRKNHGLNILREEAELDGLRSLEIKLTQNPNGTAIWFSPPGLKQDGYGEYGFAFVGTRKADEVHMSAIRLESPSIDDFNDIAKSMWGEEQEQTAEDFLRSPQVIDVPKDKAKEFIHGVFEIKPEEGRQVFQRAIGEMNALIDDASIVLRYGTADKKRQVMAVLENMSIELKERFSLQNSEKLIFLSDYKNISLDEAMLIQKYVSKPPPVAGSCGMSGKIESSNFLGKLLGSPASDSLLNKSSQEWFTCPKCTYKADGPVGNKCPGCGLTKEQFVEEGGENCD